MNWELAMKKSTKETMVALAITLAVLAIWATVFEYWGEVK